MDTSRLWRGVAGRFRRITVRGSQRPRGLAISTQLGLCPCLGYSGHLKLARSPLFQEAFVIQVRASPLALGFPLAWGISKWNGIIGAFDTEQAPATIRMRQFDGWRFGPVPG